MNYGNNCTYDKIRKTQGKEINPLPVDIEVLKKKVLLAGKAILSPANSFRECKSEIRAIDRLYYDLCVKYPSRNYHREGIEYDVEALMLLLDCVQHIKSMEKKQQDENKKIPKKSILSGVQKNLEGVLKKEGGKRFEIRFRGNYYFMRNDSLLELLSKQDQTAED